MHSKSKKVNLCKTGIFNLFDNHQHTFPQKKLIMEISDYFTWGDIHDFMRVNGEF